MEILLGRLVGKAEVGEVRHTAGQQLRIGTGNVDVAVKGNAQGVDPFLPILHFLNLVKEEINFALHFDSSRRDLIVQSHRGLQMGIAHIFKIDRDKLRRMNAGLTKLLFDKLQFL